MITCRRQATREEVAAKLAFELKHDLKVTFRHFVRECAMKTAKNGVQHRQFSKAKVQIIDGVAFVKYRGELTELTATYIEMDGGVKPFLSDIRIANEYLPAAF